MKSEPLLIDHAVVGILGKSRKWLDAVLASDAVNETGSLGMTPLFAASYAMWPHAVRELLRAGGNAREALPALRLAVRDQEGDLRRSSARYAEILGMLLSHDSVRVAPVPRRENRPPHLAIAA